MAEYATVADSTHFHTTPDEPVGENVKFAAGRHRPQHLHLPAGVGRPRRDHRAVDGDRPELGRVARTFPPACSPPACPPKSCARSTIRGWTTSKRGAAGRAGSRMAGVDQAHRHDRARASAWSSRPSTASALLARTLRGLAAQDVGDFEAIVVHDGDPGVRDPARRLGRPAAVARALEIPERGAVAKRNVGWRAASAPLIAFTDDDCEPAPGWLKAALDRVRRRRRPPVDLVQGRVDAHPEDADVAGLFKRTIEVHERYEGYPNANLVYRRSRARTRRRVRRRLLGRRRRLRSWRTASSSRAAGRATSTTRWCGTRCAPSTSSTT